ncbi:ABATE domain-containing protein [Siccirubricoccus sp. KC 17139]|uniref:ABATE domain-containing protein n=1 Tax=Siccirubricoccus soli TaxID=2899147 RepID=A0ABT1D3V2_9PROT|nr:ABATE domain-containing protein [Siccirubricoccus soli]MCO6416598.1 ABATE domain-containing protein [Siccirubricoccus soli]MCP2682733.1 ABATE domain-containing protein [Siccirubricoccus soli]
MPSAHAPGPAEALCLDFANTRYWRGSPDPTETLHRPEDLLAWCEGAGLAEAPSLIALRAAWAARPAAGEAALADALALREAAYAVFAAEAAGRAPPAPALARLGGAIAAAPPRRRLSPAPGGGYRWEVPAEQPLAPVLWSAGDLLAGPRRGRLRQCANPRCGWLFLDDSKPGTRRWCSMASCGNRAKAQRHYHRSREAAAKD